MKNTRSNKSYSAKQTIRFTLLVVGLGLTTHASLAGVLSFSSVEKITGDDGSSYQRVSIKCDARSTRSTLIKRPTTQQWCDSVLSNNCDVDKVIVANKVCSASYSIALKKHLSTSSNIATVENQSMPKNTISKAEKNLDVTALREELFAIEQSLIDIKAAHLKLRKKELALLSEDTQGYLTLRR